MEREEERKMLLEKLRWSLMREGEAAAELEAQRQKLKTISQAIIDHLEGYEND
jgi:hypothetical protein